MASVIHITEVAALLALAYVVGWAIGYVTRRLTAGSRKPVENAIPADRLAAAIGESEALVKAPVIAPLPVQSSPAMPSVAIAAVAEIPAATEILAAVAAPVPVPEPVQPATVEAVAASESTPVVEPEPVPEPAVVAPAPPPVAPVLEVAPVSQPAPTVLAPVAPVELTAPIPPAVVPFTALPASTPGQAWAGEIRGKSGVKPVVEVEPTPAAIPEPSVEPVAEVVVEAKPFLDAVIEAEPVIAAAPVIDDVPLETLAAIAPQTIVAEIEAPVAPPPAPAPPVRHDEDAAMRAIEGGWSRVRARAMPGAPELSDVGAAVAAAQTAVEQVLAQAGIDPLTTANTNKPIGLPRPRGGQRDDLKQIGGLGPLDESTLNNLGIFHFHQIASWDETEVLWMENHVFARGRIGREDWQEQARRLADAVPG